MFGHVQDRVDDLARPVADSTRARATRSSRRCSRLADGGIGGTGLGLGSPDKIPEAKNDFIFAAIGEELGLLGATAVLMAFLLIIGAGLRIAMRTDNGRSRRCSPPASRRSSACRRSSSSAASSELVPLTGITLPFVSYGGSSLVANYILLALLDPDQRLRRPPPRRAARRADAVGERWAALAAAPAQPRTRSVVGDEQADPPARAGADGLLHRAVRAAQLLQVGRKQELDGDVRQHPRRSVRDFNRPARPDRDGRRHRDRRSRSPTRRAPSSSTSAQYPTGDLFANITGYYTFASASTQLERTQNDVLAGTTPEQQLRALPG